MKGQSMYEQALGPAFAALAPSLQRLHGPGMRHVQGTLRVRVGSHLLAQAFLWLGGLPRAPEAAAPCDLRLISHEKRELWDRRIARHRIISAQKLLPSKATRSTAVGGEIIERFGLLTLHLALRVRKRSLWVRSTSARLAGMSLPSCFAIRVVARERAVDADSFHVDVRVSSPRIGRLLEYRGTLRQASDVETQAPARVPVPHKFGCLLEYRGTLRLASDVETQAPARVPGKSAGATQVGATQVR